MKKLWLAVAFAMILGTTAEAESFRHEQRQQIQRIRQGVRSGELTRQEASNLYRSQANLRWQAARDRWDGRGLTWAEQSRLRAQQNRLSRSIYRQKHDWQYR